ncbi:MAG: M48 family metallopeptidase [Halothiobacillaceae bacterium]
MNQARNKVLQVPEETIGEATARELLVAEVRAWAHRIGLEGRVREIHIRPMKRKWASISTRGRLTFSADLLRRPADFRRQVIVHELLHLKVPNHGRLFKALLKAYLSSHELYPRSR